MYVILKYLYPQRSTLLLLFRNGLDNGSVQKEQGRTDPDGCVSGLAVPALVLFTRYDRTG